MNNELQKELSNIIPKELYTNVDFWQKIVENINSGIVMIPLSFINHLSFKYGYTLDDLRTPDVISYIWNLSLHLNNHPDIFSQLGKRPNYNISYAYGDVKLVTKNKKVLFKDYKEKSIVKSRKKLVDEIPLADI